MAKRIRHTMTAAVMALGVSVGSVTTAQGHGPDMMGGYGYGPGMMGPGMMGGYGYGPGMMGPGMMGGHGPGMMGPGRMGGYGLDMLDLSDEQREQIRQIRRENHKQQLGLMNQMQEQRAELFELYSGGEADEKAIGTVYDRLADLRRQMVQNRLDTHKQLREVLTEEQRERLQRMYRYGY